MIGTDWVDPYEGYASGRGWTGAAKPTAPEIEAFRQILGPHLAHGDAILDIGFGSGAVLNWARDAGYRASGVERQSDLIAGARQAGFRAESEIGAFDPSSFNLITAFDVLEHLPVSEIRDLLRNSQRLLAPGGRFIARFPNCQVPGGLAIQYSDLTHVTPMSAPIAKMLFEQCGYKDIQIFGAPETAAAASSKLERHLSSAKRLVRMLLLRMALRLSGVPKVPPEHNLIVSAASADLRR
jgi:SAM-dependent methyltransferase